MWSGASLLLGVLSVHQLPVLPPLSVIAALGVLALAMLWRRALAPIAIVLIGFCWAAYQAQIMLDKKLPDDLENRPIRILGHVASLPSKQPLKQQFLFDIDYVLHDGQRLQLPLRVRLNWYRYSASDAIELGQYWQLTVKLKKPHGFINPGGFDYERFLFEKNIRATGYIVGRADNRLLEPARAYRYPIDQMRAKLAHTLRTTAADLDNTAIFLALSLGERSDMTPQQWQKLKDTGTVHLMAISGLHIGLIGGLVFMLAGLLWRLITPLQTHCTKITFCCLACMVAVTLYAMMASFSLPTQRALIMVLVPMGAILLRSRITPYSALNSALILILLWDTTAVLSVGFWLSFVAVSLILACVTGRLFKPLWWVGAVKIQLLLLVGMAPWLLALFGQLPTASVVANLLAIPWVGLVVVPTVLIGLALGMVNSDLSHLVLSLADSAINLFWSYLSLIELSGLFPVIDAQPSTLAIALALIATALLLLPGALGVRWAAGIMLLPLLLNTNQSALMPGELRVLVLDVGQGLAVIVRTKTHTLIYDTGDRFSETFNAADAVILPTLRSLGIDKIDRVIISHSDRDHRGGLPALHSGIAIAEVLSSAPDKLTVPASPCLAGQKWHWDGIDFAMLHPPASHDLSSKNDLSCVLMISTGTSQFLLTGDIEHRAEQLLLADGIGQVDVLVAPHHGSRTSSTEAFLDRLQPQHVIFAAGHINRFNLPHVQIEQRYRQKGATLWHTGRQGAISLIWHPHEQAWQLRAQREIKVRYWHARASPQAVNPL